MQFRLANTLKHSNLRKLTTALAFQASMSTSASNVTFSVRPSHERGGSDHGWLKTFHTFSFADYQDSRFMGFGPLRVINEDRVEPTEGFGTHSHREMEIFSYVVKGELEHKDSMGNLEILKRGDVQMTSAGTGIRHSEYNRNSTQQVHFLQIWAIPNVKALPPKYFTRNFSDDQKRNQLVKIVAPITAEGVTDKREDNGPAPVHSDLTLYATIISPSKSVTYNVPAPATGGKRKSYIHVVQTSGYNTKKSTGATVSVDGGETKLSEGDGTFAYSEGEGGKIEITNVGDKDAEVLVFDLE